MEYSVLMSVYAKERPEYFSEAIRSMQRQTAAADDFVIVCDGPLTEKLNKVIHDAQNELGKALRVVRLSENRGLGCALNVGLGFCKNELVARMDSDDISLPRRCEMQLAYFASHRDISIVGGWTGEIFDQERKIRSVRAVPETSDEIRRFLKMRNPFNHPTVMFRKSAVERVGGYGGIKLLEDYCLWAKMLLAGYEGYNIQKPLLLMRVSDESYMRRAGLSYAGAQRRFFRFLKDAGVITGREYLLSSVARTCSAMLPNALRRAAYGLLLREKI